MHTFYIDAGGMLPAEEAKHAEKVLRLTEGEEICVIDGVGHRFRASFRKNAPVEILEALPDREPPVRVTLYMGLPKADKLEFIAQKLTELGGARLVPVKMSRCVVKTDAKDDQRRQERLERISREAVKQCGRGGVPEILPAMTWKQAAADMAQNRLNIVPWEEAEGTRVKDVYARLPQADSIGIVIGPEGGMSAEEVQAMTEAGVIPVTLGPRILRCETAAVISVALCMQLWGDL